MSQRLTVAGVRSLAESLGLQLRTFRYAYFDGCNCYALGRYDGTGMGEAVWSGNTLAEAVGFLKSL